MAQPADNSLSIEDAVTSWVIALRGANRSPQTIRSYLLATGQLTDHLRLKGHSLPLLTSPQPTFEPT